MKNTLIISGHPDLNASIANRAILDTVAAALPEAQIRKLDTLYPDYRIDVAAEQQALQAADLIVWQFPFSWYSLPGLMKLWLDQVFLHGFAHGSKAVLGGKKLIVSLTAGAPGAVYAPDGFLRHNIEDYFHQFATTAIFCGLDMQPPIWTTDLSFLQRDDEAAIEAQRALAREHAGRLIAAIRAA